MDLSAEEYGAIGCCVEFGDSSMSEFWRGLVSDHQLHQVCGRAVGEDKLSAHVKTALCCYK